MPIRPRGREEEKERESSGASTSSSSPSRGSRGASTSRGGPGSQVVAALVRVGVLVWVVAVALQVVALHEW